MPKGSSTRANAGRRRTFAARYGAALAAGCTTLVLLLVVNTFLPQRSQEGAPPPPGQWFDDRAGMVSAQFASGKSTYLQSYLRQALHMFVLVVVEPAAPAGGIEQYSTEAASSWQFGAQGADNGIVLFVFPTVRTARLEVGYGLEGAIPDIEAKHLLEATLLPRFSAGKYEDGFEDFLSALEKRLKLHADEAAKADKPMNIVAFAIGIVRQLPRIAIQARDMFQASDFKERVIMAIFAAVFAGMFGYGLTGVAVGAWALVQLPWRAMNPGATGARDLHLADIVEGATSLAAIVFGIAFLGLGSQAVMEAHGKFSGAGATVAWPPR